MGGNGLGESRASSCPLLSKGSGGQTGERPGKGAVQFHFLHPMFTQLQAHPLCWGMMMDIGCLGTCPGVLTVEDTGMVPCQDGGGRAWPCVHTLVGE